MFTGLVAEHGVNTSVTGDDAGAELAKHLDRLAVR